MKNINLVLIVLSQMAFGMASFADEGNGNHPQFTPEEKAAWQAAHEKCENQVGALKPGEDENPHWKAMKKCMKAAGFHHHHHHHDKGANATGTGTGQ
jgi:hypothetical protein